MIDLSAAPACDQEDRLCLAVERATGNEWLAAAADWLIAEPLAILTIVALGFAVRWLARKALQRVIARAVAGVLPAEALRARGVDPAELALAGERRRQRAETMGSVLQSFVSFVIFVTVAVMVVAELGFNIGPLVASAGLVGAALGFGAQSLVKDFLSGVFIFFEDQYGVGDEVVVGETKGVVESLALRVTRLRGEDGTVWYLRNGEILRVGNLSQNPAYEEGTPVPGPAPAPDPTG